MLKLVVATAGRSLIVQRRVLVDVTPQLSGRSAVVTGGASGNGRAICETFADEGAAVVVADLQEEPRQGGTPTHELIAERGGDATFVECDVNNAGIFRGEEFLDVREDDLQQFLDVNVKGVFFGAQVAAERMVEGEGGSIVNMSSIGAIRALGAYTSYDLTKGAVASLTYSLADRFGDEGIRVNCIMPGIVGTAMTEDDVPIVGTEQGDQYAKSSIPMGRFGEPEEVADAALFLASEQSSYVNGESLVVDGGVSNTG